MSSQTNKQAKRKQPEFSSSSSSTEFESTMKSFKSSESSDSEDSRSQSFSFFVDLYNKLHESLFFLALKKKKKKSRDTFRWSR